MTTEELAARLFEKLYTRDLTEDEVSALAKESIRRAQQFACAWQLTRNWGTTEWKNDDGGPSGGEEL